MNNFVEVSINDVPANINLKFLNQQAEIEKFYTVRYGPANPGCKNFSLQTKGHLINSNHISIKLILENESSSAICFVVIASNGVKTISVEGIHLFGKRR